VIALPLAIAFGVASYGPLGPAYGAMGAMAGLMGAALTGLLASLFGGCRPQVTGPTGPMSIVARSTIASLLMTPLLAALPSEELIPSVIWLFSLTVILGGLLQWFLAWSKLGNLVRGLPYPVVAGFMNGVSILILINQIKPFLGWDNDSPWSQVFSLDWTATHFLALATSVVTALLMILLPKVNKKIPPAFFSLLLGTLFFYFLPKMLSLPLESLSQESLIIGPIPSGLLTPVFFQGLHSIGQLLFQPSILSIVVLQSLVLGLLGTIDTLMTSVIADLKTGERHNSNRELFGQGLGNMITGIFGALPGAGATVRTLSNIDSGGKTGLSGIFHSLFLMASLVFLGPLFQIIPLPVLAAILVVIAIKMIDIWSLELLRKSSARSDSLVLLTVTAFTILTDLVIAVGLGFLLAAILFVRKQKSLGTQLVFTDGRYLRSCVQRNRRQEQVLIQEGQTLHVVQIRGNLFFGSSDELLGRIEENMKDRQRIVLDMEKLVSLDLTGGKMLLDLIRRWTGEGKKIYWGGWKEESTTALFLRDLGIENILPQEMLFPSFDQAMEKAEDHLLDRHQVYRTSLSIQDLEFFSSLENSEQEILLALFEEKALSPGDYLFYQGQDSKELCFVLEGTIEVNGFEEATQRIARVAAYGPGQHLGLMSWLEGKAKEYTARAAGEVRIAFIPEESLNHLLEANPSLGLHLMKIWARQLAMRVRRFQNTDLHLSERNN